MTATPPGGGPVTNISPSGLITLNRPPFVTSSPTNSSINAGGNTSFTATASDTYPTDTTVKWQVSVAGGAFTDLANGGVYSNVTTTTLTLTTVPPLLFDGNVYRAVFNNSGNYPATSAKATLTVQKPSLIYVDQSFTGTTFGSNPASAPTGLTLQYGINAFADIQSGLDNLDSNGTLVLFATTTSYAGFTLNNPVAEIDINQNPQNPGHASVLVVNSAVTLHQDVTVVQGTIQPGTNVLAAADLEFDGAVGESGGVHSLTKTGSGTLLMNAANTYTGTTMVQGGVLKVIGSLVSDVTVNAGAALQGGGSIQDDVTVQPGAAFNPGNAGIGTLTIGGDFIWNGSTNGSAMATFDLSSNGNTSDKLAITGALTKGSGTTFKFDFQGVGLVANTYVLATFGSTTFSASDFSAINPPGGFPGIFTIVGSELRVTFNTPPTASVVLNTASPKTNDTLTATVTASDVNNDTITLTYVWKVNGSVKKTTTGTASLTDTFNLSIAGNGNRGDSISVEVTPNDGKENGQTAISTSATVGNSQPTASVVLNTTSPKTNDTLTATLAASDADNNAVSLTYVWKVNGSVKKTTAATSSLTDTFDLSIPENGDSGDSITVDVVPNDGLVDGLQVTSSAATVDNTAPAISSAPTANPNPAGIGETVVFTAAATDADGNSITYTWDFGDGTQGSGATVTHAYASDSTYNITLACDDGSGGTATASLQVEVVSTTEDLQQLDGTLALTARKDTVKVVTVFPFDPTLINASENIAAISVGGLTRTFTFTKPSKVTSPVRSARLQLMLFKRQKVPVIRIAMTDSGTLRAALFAGQTLDVAGRPTTLLAQFTINGKYTGNYYPTQFKVTKKTETARFGLKFESGD